MTGEMRDMSDEEFVAYWNSRLDACNAPDGNTVITLRTALRRLEKANAKINGDRHWIAGLFHGYKGGTIDLDELLEELEHAVKDDPPTPTDEDKKGDPS